MARSKRRESPEKRAVRRLGLVLFLIYLVCLIYFLFFADWYNHTPGSHIAPQYNLVPFREIRRFLVYRKHFSRMSLFLNLGGNIIGIFFAFLAAVGYVVYLFGLDAPSVRQESSFAIAGYVMSSAAAVNFIRCLLSGKPLFVTAPEQIGMMILLSVVCVFMAILFYAIGVRLIGPGNAALVNTLEPVLACIFGYLLVGDLLTGRMLIGAALVVIAVLITNLPDKSKS